MVGDEEPIDDVLGRLLAAGQMDGQTTFVVGRLGRIGVLEKEGENDGGVGLLAARQMDGQIAAAVLLAGCAHVGSEEGFDDCEDTL